jgi:thiamine kinase
MDKPLQPETAINSWRSWDASLPTRPKLIGPLSGGRSNQSFLLDSDGRKVVLRINGPESVLPGSSRSYEMKIWRAASKKGIAPPLLHVDQQNRYLVSAYIDNGLPTQAHTLEHISDRALDLLGQCHQLKVEAPDIDYAGHIEHYWQIIEAKNAPINPFLIRQQEPMQRLLEDLIGSAIQSTLCHHDPVVENFVGSPEKLYLIDWEYAAQGLPVMDYAALSVEWGISDATVLECTNFELELLLKAKMLYRYLCLLWEVTTN